MNQAAYLLVNIDSAGKITQAGIYSEESPTVRLPSVWATITKVDFNERYSANVAEIVKYVDRSPHLHWLRPHIKRYR